MVDNSKAQARDTATQSLLSWGCSGKIIYIHMHVPHANLLYANVAYANIAYANAMYT